MSITTREQVLAAVRRVINLGASHDEAIASVAQALHLSHADVIECLQCDEVAA